MIQIQMQIEIQMHMKLQTYQSQIQLQIGGHVSNKFWIQMQLHVPILILNPLVSQTHAQIQIPEADADTH